MQINHTIYNENEENDLSEFIKDGWSQSYRRQIEIIDGEIYKGDKDIVSTNKHCIVIYPSKYFTIKKQIILPYPCNKKEIERLVENFIEN